MKNQSPNILAVIVNWNNARYTVNAIQSLDRNQYNNISIIVADNGSTDKSIDLIKQLQQNVKIISIGSNIGYGAAINYVYNREDVEKYDLFLVLNNDVEFDSNFISKLVEVSSNYGSGNIFGSKIMYLKDKNKIWYLGSVVRAGAFLIKHRFIRHDNFKINSSFETDYITGCAMMFYIEDFKKLYFDESFKMYGEDVDICLRARSMGFKCIVEPESVLFHAVSASYASSFSLRKNIMKLISRIKIIYRNAMGVYS